MRETYRITGNLFEDFFAAMLAYPLTVVQLENHMRRLTETKDMLLELHCSPLCRFDLGKKKDAELATKNSAVHPTTVEGEDSKLPAYRNAAYVVSPDSQPTMDSHRL